MAKFTFRRAARVTGLAGIGADTPSTTIKLRGKEAGVLKSPASSRLSSAPDQWTVRFTVAQEPTPQDSCTWRWAALKRRFNSEQEGRGWLASVDADALVAQLNIVLRD